MNKLSEDIVVENSHVEYLEPDEFELLSSSDVPSLSGKVLGIENNILEDKINHVGNFSSIKQYEEEWNELYNQPEIDLNKLKKRSTEGDLRASRFRSICWRCLLGILHSQPQQWLCQLQMYRNHYNEIYLELEQNPWNVQDNNPLDNPLSQESDSIWQKYFCDEELKSVVQQDVKRTFPGMEFFRRNDIQKMMVRILFCYARQNPTLCYRQGMHEILAPLIFILHCDQQAFLHAKEQTVNLDESICEIMNPTYLEQDAYCIFKSVMNHIECSYRLKNSSLSSFSTETLNSESKTCQNEVISRLDYIKKELLQPNDPELCDHLQKLDIPLHLFGLRWLRLLFGSEFPLHDLLVLWDFIFSYHFETINFIVVAMLVAIRQILLSGDYTDCLSTLMRYPSGVDISFIINYALHLYDPLKTERPDIASSFYRSVNTRSKHEREFVNKQSKTVKRFKKEQLKSSKWFVEKAYALNEKRDSDGSITSGFFVDDPHVLRNELEQAKTLLNVVRLKLVNFHSTLISNLPVDRNPHVQSALDGILELSCLLKSYNQDSHYEIETACEASEIKDSNASIPKSVEKRNQLSPILGEVSVNSEKKFNTLPRTKKSFKSGELKVFKQFVGGDIKDVPMTDPLHLIKKVKDVEYLSS